MKKQNFRYKYFDKAVLRTPLFPLDALHKPDDFLASQEFQEAIFIASPELFRAKEADTKDKADKTENSLYKYFSRSSTRCTPFGLFAGCTTVPIAEKEDIILPEINKYRRCTRLDMQYLCALIRKIENNPYIRPQLRFYPNDSIYYIAGQLRYIEYHYKNTRRMHQISSIEESEYVLLILDAAKNGQKSSELAELLLGDDITLEEALDFINEMIESQLLKSELDPAVVGDDVLSVLIKKLQQLENAEIVRELLEIQRLLSDIDSRPIGYSLSIYDEIVKIIKTIGIGYAEKFLFQTDMFKPVVNGCIDNKTIDGLADCLTFLSKINNLNSNGNLQKFKQDFAERYQQQEIPLTMALDNELGLGYPSNNNHGDINNLLDDLAIPILFSGDNRITASQTDLMLLKKYIAAIKNHESTVFVDEKDFQILDHGSNVYPDTCGVICSIMKDVNGDQIIYLKSAGAGGACLLGRFCHIDNSIEEIVRVTADFEKNNEDVIYAEIAHIPESRIGNISSRPVLRDVVVHYLSNTDQTTKLAIDISDLMLSVKNNRLYLRSKQLGRQIIPKLTCAHNYSITPIPIYRFLCDMQNQDAKTGFYLQWGELFKGLEYLPRLQYGNTILTRQRWIMLKDEIDDCYKMSDQDLLLFFQAFIRKRNMTESIVISEGDNEMYIDLTNIKSIKLMLDLVKKRRGFEVHEFLFNQYNPIVLAERSQKYANEVIIVFHR